MLTAPMPDSALDPDVIELLKDSVSRYHLRALVVAYMATWAAGIDRALSRKSFRATDDGDDTAWSRFA